MADYAPLNWQAGVTPLSEANMDHLETQYARVVEEFIRKNLMHANSIIIATGDHTPIQLLVPGSRIPARLAAGNIVAATPAEIMALLSGSAGAEFLLNTQKIGGVVDPTTNQQVATKKYVDDEVAGVGDVGEGHITLLPPNYNAIIQGTWAISATTTEFMGGVLNNTSGNDADQIDFEVYLAVGTYTLRVMAYKTTSKGITDIDIEGSEEASFDWYAAGPTRNTTQSQAGISIAASGLKTISLRLDGKHASSSGYGHTLQYIALWRTA